MLVSLVRWSVPRRGLRRTFAFVTRLAQQTRTRRPTTVSNDEVWLAVQRIADRLPVETTCLPRSLSLWLMLRRRGLRAELRVGVAGGREDFLSHAWVELDGVAVREPAGKIEMFQTLDADQFFARTEHASPKPMVR